MRKEPCSKTLPQQPYNTIRITKSIKKYRFNMPNSKFVWNQEPWEYPHNVSTMSHGWES